MASDRPHFDESAVSPCCCPFGTCWPENSTGSFPFQTFVKYNYKPVRTEEEEEGTGVNPVYTFPQPKAELALPNILPPTSSVSQSDTETMQPTGIEPSIQYSLYYDHQKKMLAVYLQQAYNFKQKYPRGKFHITVYTFPKKNRVFRLKITETTASPVLDKVFQCPDFAESLTQTLVIGVHQHTQCFSQKMVGVIPIDLKSADLCGHTVRRSILDDHKSIKWYSKDPSEVDGDLFSSSGSSISCGCHDTFKDVSSKSANAKLVIASFIALLFMIGELLGGYFAGSLAIMTDAAHMLSDLAGFLISLFAIWVGSRPPSKRMSFGWHRAEVVGAIISVLIVWVLTGVLFYEAILRVINPELIDVNADIMLITACVGVFVNVFMCAVLGHGHGHSHGGGHGHSHGGHSHNGHSHSEHSHSSTGNQGEDVEKGTNKEHRLNRLKCLLRAKKRKENSDNINVRAAFVHVIGDLIQSIGVVIVGYIIWFRPDWKLADPICTFLFCVLVLFSTLNVLKDALRVLMEATPTHLDYEDVKADLQDIPGVKHAHSLHIWSLTTNRTALAAHLAVETGAKTQDVLDKASKILTEKHNILHSTLQVEDYHELMDDCGTCQETNGRSFCWPLC